MTVCVRQKQEVYADSDMNNFIFENKTKVYFGKGCVKEFLGSLMKDYQKVMLAYGGGSIKKNGIYDEVLYILKREGKEIVEFSGILPCPTYAKVLEGIELARKNKVGILLGVGGGSVMDCCKAVALGTAYKGDLWKNFWERREIIDFPVLPLGVIVTCGGSGSECNGVSVLTGHKGEVIIGKDYAECNPRFALIDPAYSFSEPREQMAAEGIAALSHVLEVYFSIPDQDNVSDDLCEALMKSIIRNLKKALENPLDYEARSNLLWAAAMAKNRIIKIGKRGDFICRQAERELEAQTGCLHGYGAAVLRPTYYRHIFPEHIEKFARFAKNVWNIPDEGKNARQLAEEGVLALTGFIQAMGLPGTMKELGFKDRRKIKGMVSHCMAAAGNDRSADPKVLEEIFNDCF